jgi:hypothetical protein
MTSWASSHYGDPCRECGFDWSISKEQAREIVETAPAILQRDLTDATGRERHPDLTWPVVAYLAHMCDNLRIWAERVAGITRGGSPAVVRYDENALATARQYESLSIPGVQWSLARAAADWLVAVNEAPDDLVMDHGERGRQTLHDVVLSNAHDVAHHTWDIRRSLSQDPPA